MSTYEVTYQTVTRYGRRTGGLLRQRVQAESAVRAQMAFEDRLGTRSAHIIEIRDVTPTPAPRPAPERTGGLVGAACEELELPRRVQAA